MAQGVVNPKNVFTKSMILITLFRDSKVPIFSLLASLPLVLSTVSCTDKEADRALADEVEQKQAEFEALKRDLTAKNEEIRRVSEEVSEMEAAIRNLQRLQKQELEITKEYNDLKKYEDEVKATIAMIDASLTAWRTATRSSLIGSTLGVIDLGGGKILNDPVILEVSDDSVRFQTQGAETVVKLAELPIEIRERLADESLVIQKLQIERSQK
ncbi:MAG: hypothetical protein JNJ70_03285 [Verrucomicrobiales bacterium]|nr:hypothetical protein [Verrucomicrobiales bacterium]